MAASSQVSTWILAIARFKAISVLRQRQNEAFNDDDVKAIAHQADDPEVALQKKDNSNLLLMCLT